MSNNLQEEFRNNLFRSLKEINEKLNDNKPLTDDDLSILLMSSILEEEG